MNIKQMIPCDVWRLIASHASLRTCQTIRCLARDLDVPLAYPEPRTHTFTLYRRSRATVCDVEWSGRAWRVQVLYPWCGLLLVAHLPTVFWHTTRTVEYAFDTGVRLRVPPAPTGRDVEIRLDWTDYTLSALNDVTSALH
jgi:hypothetical protein